MVILNFLESLNLIIALIFRGSFLRLNEKYSITVHFYISLVVPERGAVFSNQHSRGEDFSLAWYKNMPTFKVSHFAPSIFVYEYLPLFEFEITIVFLPRLSSIQMHLMMT